VVANLETVFLRDLLLTLLYDFIIKLDHLTRTAAHHMIMVLATIQLENGLSALEMMPVHQSRSLELRKYAIYCSQAYLFTRLEKHSIYRLGREVMVVRSLEELQNLHARQGNLEPRFSKILTFHNN
jgi:hypothetical protein